MNKDTLTVEIDVREDTAPYSGVHFSYRGEDLMYFGPDHLFVTGTNYPQRGTHYLLLSPCQAYTLNALTDARSTHPVNINDLGPLNFDVIDIIKAQELHLGLQRGHTKSTQHTSELGPLPSCASSLPRS